MNTIHYSTKSWLRASINGQRRYAELISRGRSLEVRWYNPTMIAVKMSTLSFRARGDTAYMKAMGKHESL